jgi:uncharacterized membrane protein YphA (DoxX/SURF4 family)
MTIGGRILGLAAIAMGLVGFGLHDFSPLWRAAHGIATPGGAVAHEVAVFVRYAAMIVGGIAINLGRRAAAAGALVLAADFAAWMAVTVGPTLLRDPGTWVNWEDLAEQTAMSLGAVLAWSLLSGAGGAGEAGGAGDVGGGAARRAWAGAIASRAFGVCLVVFGLSDVVYLAHTAAMVPAWLPPSQVFWTWVACVAHVAAGLAVVSGVRARLAAMLVVAMYAVFAVLVHLPLVILEPRGVGHWVEQGANLILLGAAWCLADWLGRPRAGRAAA